MDQLCPRSLSLNARRPATRSPCLQSRPARHLLEALLPVAAVLPSRPAHPLLPSPQKVAARANLPLRRHPAQALSPPSQPARRPPARPLMARARARALLPPVLRLHSRRRPMLAAQPLPRPSTLVLLLMSRATWLALRLSLLLPLTCCNFSPLNILWLSCSLSLH